MQRSMPVSEKVLPISKIHGLSEREINDLEKALGHFDDVARCRWSLVGSLSYRFCHNGIRIEPGLRDIDIVLTPGRDQDPALLLSERVVEPFDVLHIGASDDGGYHYQLCHKDTGLTFDVFSRSRVGYRARTFILGCLPIHVLTGEETLLHGIEHLLMCHQAGQYIGLKRVYNARLAWKCVDRALLLRLLEERRSRLQPLLPVTHVDRSALDIVQYALRLKPTKRMSAAPRRPSTITVHGLQAQMQSSPLVRLRGRQREPLKRHLRKKCFRLWMRVSLLLPNSWA